MIVLQWGDVTQIISLASLGLEAPPNILQLPMSDGRIVKFWYTKRLDYSWGTAFRYSQVEKAVA